MGTSISKDEFVEFLISLGFDVNKNIEIPSFRNDIETDNDIAEEIARLIGYNKIQSKELQIRNKIKNLISRLNKAFRDISHQQLINKRKLWLNRKSKAGESGSPQKDQKY